MFLIMRYYVTSFIIKALNRAFFMNKRSCIMLNAFAVVLLKYRFLFKQILSTYVKVSCYNRVTEFKD